MPLVSILLPSLRPSLVTRVINEIEFSEPDLDYEVVIVSPFPVSGKKVVWVKEVTEGLVAAFNASLDHSVGEYVTIWTDDMSPTPGSITRAVDFMKQHKSPFVGGFNILDEAGQLLSSTCSYYGFFCPCFTIASRETIEMIGGYYDTIYKMGWCDPDLCLRVYAIGGTIKWCPDAYRVLYNHNQVIPKDPGDFITFIKRWHPILGRGVPEEVVLGSFENLRNPTYYPPIERHI